MCQLRNLLLQKFEKFQQAAILRNLDQLKPAGCPKGPQQCYGAAPSKRQKVGGNSNGGVNDQNQKLVDEFLMRLKKMYDGGDVSHQQSGRQMQAHGAGGPDDSTSHRSHSFNETNTVGSASHMQGPRDRAAGMMRPGLMRKLAPGATTSGSGRPSLCARTGNGMAQDQ